MLTSFAANTACSFFQHRLLEPRKSAVLRRFFVFHLPLQALLIFPTGLQAETECRIRQLHANTEISHVIDGDTVVLENDERLRLIGIDTPEIGYEGRPSEPGAHKARNYLQKLLANEKDLQLQWGIEKRDRHGRLLGHLFSSSGENIQANILRKGLATLLNIPPNTEYLDCYQGLARQARQARRGLWANVRYQARAADSLQGSERGFYIVHGQVSRIGQSRSSSWLNMGSDLAISIRHSDLAYFPGLQPAKLLGKQIEVAGKLYRHKGQLRMRLRHPADLVLLFESEKHE